MANLVAQSSTPTVTFQDTTPTDWWYLVGVSSSSFKLQRNNSGTAVDHFEWGASENTSLYDLKVSNSTPALVLHDTGGGSVDVGIEADGTNMLFIRDGSTIAQSNSDGYLCANNAAESTAAGTTPGDRAMRWSVHTGTLGGTGMYPRVKEITGLYSNKIIGTTVMLSADGGTTWQVYDYREPGATDYTEFYVQAVRTSPYDKVKITYASAFGNDDPYRVIIFYEAP